MIHMTASALPLVLLASASLSVAGTLWVAPPYSGNVYRLTDTGKLLDTIPVPQVFGVATDGRHVYFSRSATIEKRTGDGRRVLSTFPLSAEYSVTDLAWDWTRNRLWALNIITLELQQIHPDTGVVERSIPIPASDPDGVLGRVNALGLAHDPMRDRLYVSFCPGERLSPCTPPPAGTPAGLILSFDARSGLGYGTLFRTQGMSFGLAHSVQNDSLWVVTYGTVRGVGYATAEYTFAGAYLREVRPNPHAYAYGLDFLPDSPAVVSVSVGAVRPQLPGCAGEFRFRGTITTVGPGTVRYRFVHHDGTMSPDFTTTFSRAATLPVEEETLFMSGGRDGWTAIQVLAPNGFISQVGRVSLTCQ